MQQVIITPKVGQLVEKSEWGGGTCFVRVEEVFDEIKNGQPGFTGTVMKKRGSFPTHPVSFVPTTAGKWGYNDQIIRVVR